MTFTNVGKCSKLPESMNGVAYPIGCPGAVWSNGNSSDKYCAGLDSNGAMSYPWWKDCCKWDGTKCVPKGNTVNSRYNKAEHAVQSYAAGKG